jgi:hypothetical protein
MERRRKMPMSNNVKHDGPTVGSDHAIEGLHKYRALQRERKRAQRAYDAALEEAEYYIEEQARSIVEGDAGTEED